VEDDASVILEDEANADEEVDAKGRMMEGTLIPNILVEWYRVYV
jgi:hypothetical protein